MLDNTSRRTFLRRVRDAAFALLLPRWPISNNTNKNPDAKFPPLSSEYAPAVHIIKENGRYAADGLSRIGLDGNAIISYPLTEKLYFQDVTTAPKADVSPSGNYISCLGNNQKGIPSLTVFGPTSQPEQISGLEGVITGSAWRNTGRDELLITTAQGDKNTSVYQYFPGEPIKANKEWLYPNLKILAAGEDVLVFVNTKEPKSGHFVTGKDESSYIWDLRDPILDINSRCLTGSSAFAYIGLVTEEQDVEQKICLMFPHGTDRLGNVTNSKPSGQGRYVPIERFRFMSPSSDIIINVLQVYKNNFFINPKNASLSQHGTMLFSAQADPSSPEVVVSTTTGMISPFLATVYGEGTNPVWLARTKDPEDELLYMHNVAYTNGSTVVLSQANMTMPKGRTVGTSEGYSPMFGGLVPFIGTPHVLFYDRNGAYRVL